MRGVQQAGTWKRLVEAGVVSRAGGWRGGGDEGVSWQWSQQLWEAQGVVRPCIRGGRAVGAGAVEGGRKKGRLLWWLEAREPELMM